MKKIAKTLAIMAAVPLLMSSCVMAISHQVTGNPVGSKVGTVKTKTLKVVQDAGIGAAAKKGGITKIATVDIVYYTTGSIKVTVTGE